MQKSSSSELTGTAKAAWVSRHALPLAPHIVLIVLGLVLVPLVDASMGLGAYWQLLLSAAVGHIIWGLLLATSWYFIYRRGRARHWSWLVVIAVLAGLVRGFATWFTGGLLGNLETQELAGRLVFGSLTSTSTVLLLALPIYLIREGNQRLGQLAEQLNQEEQEKLNLQAQLDWLIGRKLEGLGAELSVVFLDVLNDLRGLKDGSQLALYKRIARQLRNTAVQQVRIKSQVLFQPAVAKKPRLLETLGGAVAANPLPFWPAILLFTFGHLTVELRVFEAAADLLAVGVASLALGLGLRAVKKLRAIWPGLSWLWPHLVSILAASGGVGVTALAQGAGGSLAEDWLFVFLWAEFALLLVGWLEVTARTYGKSVSRYQRAIDAGNSDLQWLALRLESTNLELAKYLHGILQSRLMAHTINLENLVDKKDNEGLRRSTQELIAVLASPLDGFSPSTADLATELQKVFANWAGVIEITSVFTADTTSSSEATVQLVREAIANASKHGYATRIRVSVIDSVSDERVVIVADNGIGPRTGPPGLGSQIFDALTQGNWKLTKSDLGGAQFEARLRV